MTALCGVLRGEWAIVAVCVTEVGRFFEVDPILLLNLLPELRQIALFYVISWTELICAYLSHCSCIDLFTVFRIRLMKNLK